MHRRASFGRASKKAGEAQAAIGGFGVEISPLRFGVDRNA